jgi:hypothetical protein
MGKARGALRLLDGVAVPTLEQATRHVVAHRLQADHREAHGGLS